MSVISWLREKAARALVPEAFEFRESLLAGQVDQDDSLYRRLSGGSPRDLPPFQQDRAVKIVHYLYKTNPLAFRLTEDVKNWVVGEGILVRHENPVLQKVLDQHWKDPVNRWPVHQESLVRDLGLFGELCLPVFVNRANGHVRLGVLDSERIEKVRNDPENARVPVEVVRKGKGKITERTFQVIHVDELPGSKNLGRLVGGIGSPDTWKAAFYFALNKTSTATRGTPDLLSLADFVDAYDQYLFDDMERTVLAKRFLFDLEVQGADTKQLREKAAMLKDVKPGSVYAHNQNEKLQVAAPNLRHVDNSKASETYSGHIHKTAGWPERKTSGSPDDRRRGLPEEVLKRVKARQIFVRRVLEDILRFVLDQWWIANPEKRASVFEGGKVPLDPDEINEALHAFDVIMPMLTELDLAAGADSVLKVFQAIALAEGGLSQKEIRDMRRAVVKPGLGVELNPSDDPETEDPPPPGGEDEGTRVAKEALARGPRRLDAGHGPGATRPRDPAPQRRTQG